MSKFTEKQSRYGILNYMSYEHLPISLKEVSRPFCELALSMAEELPFCAETSTMLRKILEAKDCAVRAKLDELPASTIPTKSEGDVDNYIDFRSMNSAFDQTIYNDAVDKGFTADE